MATQGNIFFFKTFLGVFLVVLLSSFSFDENYPKQIKIVRAGFYEAVNDSKKAKPLAKIISDFQSRSALVKVYEGANCAIMAKNKWSPFAAIKLLKKSNIMMNAAIKKSPTNVEIHFIRFAVQKNIPEFLGYSKDVEKDKNFILQNINNFKANNLSEEMRLYILNFLIEQAGYNEAELQIIEEKLS